MTPATTNQGGAIWSASKVSVANGFDTSFTFQITGSGGSGGGADGLAFVVQNTSGTSGGSQGGSLFYQGMPNSLAVEFDTFQNAWDTNNNHIAIHTKGVNANSAGTDGRVAQYDPSFDINDGAPHQVRVKYANGTLSVFVAGLTSPVLQYTVDLATLLSLDAGNAWVGLTSSTGSGYGAHDILSWAFCSQ